MTWNDLTKQNKLLIYMSRNCIDTPFVVKDRVDDAIAYGITTSKDALSNLLYNLRANGFVVSCRLQNGMNGYWLTQNGQDFAEWLIDDDLKVPDFASLAQPSKTEKARITDVVDLVKMVADIVAQSYGTQPKQNENADASNLVKNAIGKTNTIAGQPKKTTNYEEEIARLKKENASLKEQLARKQEHQPHLEELKDEIAAKDEKITRLSKSLDDSLCRLNAKTERVVHLEDSLKKVENMFAQAASWIHSLMNGGN